MRQIKLSFKLSFRAHYNIIYFTMQIVTGIEVNSKSYFPQLREYCPRADDWLMMTLTICFVIPLIKMDTELI